MDGCYLSRIQEEEGGALCNSVDVDPRGGFPCHILPGHGDED